VLESDIQIIFAPSRLASSAKCNHTFQEPWIIIVLPASSSHLSFRYVFSAISPPREVALSLHLDPQMATGLPVKVHGDEYQTSFSYSSSIHAMT